VSLGRLGLYADRPFDPAQARARLADVERRLETSPIDDHRSHRVFVANAEWRRQFFFNASGGAAGVNFYPVTNDVFIRHSDINRDTVYGASGLPAAAPRTFAYYAAHEICHSFTAERLGASRGWNSGLPQWVREGYADYVGMGGQVDIDDLYRRYRADDPQLDFQKSHTYARFRLLVAYLLQRERWTVDELLASRLSLTQAEALMNAGTARP
jgi:hypothetical protein